MLQELKELNSRIKAFKEMARMEDQLRALESRKRPRSQGSPEFPEDTIAPPRLSKAPLPSRSSLGHRQTHVRPSIEIDSSSSNSSTSSTITYHCHKRQRLTRGIKITLSYTLKVNSSLQEQGDQKKDIEQVFKGDLYIYQKGSQKILKALDYLDSNLKSLWYTFNDQQKGIGKWSTFVNQTRDNIQNGQNATATLYEQLNATKQLLDKSPVQFNAYLSTIERDLLQQDDKALAIIFYSKLTRELKR